jgi:hypothetical protein
MFLNPLMLAGLGGAVLPVVLHLLNRARYRTMDWGAMMFLPGAEGRQEQSTRIKQILLLLLRMAIVATLALALARPVIGAGWAAMGADPHCCAVILVDTSASMAYDDGGGPRIDAARRAALAVLAGLQRGDEINLITLGDERDSADTPPPSDLQTAASRVADLHVSDGRADVASGLTAAARLFARSNAANRLLVLICDRQAASWKSVNQDFAVTWRESAKGRVQSERANPAIEPKFVVISVGSEGCENVAVDRVTAPIAPVVRDVPVPLDVTVHNYGRSAANALPLSLESSGGHSVFNTTVDLAPGASATVTLTPRFGSIGQHVLNARIGPDAHIAGGLAFDDELDAIVNVVDPLDVCIITGDLPNAVGIRQADAIRLALMPYKTADEKGPDLANVAIINPTDPWPTDFSAYRVIVLADVPRLDDAQAQRIEQFVFDGGGLLIAPGNLLNIDSYNDSLYRDAAGVLPAKLSPAITPSTASIIIPSDLADPVLAFLHGSNDTTFTATASRYLPATVHAPEGHVIAHFSDHSPMLAEKTFGHGRVLLSTTTLGSEWSTFPRSSLFLPLVQSSVQYLASGEEDNQTLTLGQPIEAHITGAVGDRASIVLPDGSRQSVDLVRGERRQAARFTDTNRAGHYDVIFHTTGGDTTESFVVQSTRDESDLTPLTADRWSELQQWLGFTRMDAQSADLAASAADRRGGREMWLTLIALVLGLTVVESAVSKYLSSDA